MTEPRKNIVWITSYPKSGNTWFRLFLSSIINPEKSTIDINDINSTALIASNRSIFDRIAGTNSSDLTLEEINLIRPHVYRSISAENNDITYIKAHEAWQKNNAGHDLFPNEITKCVVLIVRNPFDIAISFANHSGICVEEAISRINNVAQCMSNSQSSLPSQLCQYISNWSEHFRSWVDHSGLDVKIIRYEDLLSQPVESFSKALDFIGINVGQAQIKSAIKKCSFEVLQEQERKVGFREKPIKADFFFKIGKKDYSKNILSDEAISQIVNNHSEVMQRLGYTT